MSLTLRDFEQGDVFNKIGKQAFASAVRQGRITPDRFEVARHGDQPIADGIVQSQPIFAQSTLSVLLHISQNAQFVVPFALKRSKRCPAPTLRG